MDVGAQLLSAIIRTGDIASYRKLNLADKFFLGTEKSLWSFVANHVAQYSALPKMETIEVQFTDLPLAPEPVAFYADQVEQRYLHKRINTCLTDVNQHMKDQDVFTAKGMLVDLMSDIAMTEARTQLADFAMAHDLYMAEYHKKQTQDILEVFLDWPSLDKTGGLRPGDVASIVGRPAMGKTFLVVRAALQAMAKQGLNVLLVSMEMSLQDILERAVAIYTHFPMDHIQNYALTTKQQKTLPSLLLKTKSEHGKLWILDGNFASTVSDIFALARMLNIQFVCIDGAYLLQHPDKRLDRTRRVEENIQLIKRNCGQIAIPALLSYQFNREAIKKQKKSGGKEFGGLEDLAHSDAIGQVSSLVMGMFEEESVETILSRLVRIMKGRKGHIGQFRVNWDFLNMDFQEILDDEKKKAGVLQFV